MPFLKLASTGNFCKARVRHPKIPFRPKHDVTSVGKSRLTGFVQVSANMVRMPVGKNDRADLVRFNPFGPKKR